MPEVKIQVRPEDVLILGETNKKYLMTDKNLEGINLLSFFGIHNQRDNRITTSVRYSVDMNIKPYTKDGGEYCFTNESILKVFFFYNGKLFFDFNDLGYDVCCDIYHNSINLYEIEFI